MDRRRTLVLVAFLATLTAPGCQDLNTMITGEKFTSPAEGSPRVEVELDIDMQDTYGGVLVGADQVVELNDATSELVLSIADVSLRFYPILSEQYGSDEARPPHRMIVEIHELAVNLDQEMIEEEGEEPLIQSFVKSVECVASAKVERRRADGPPLVIGRGKGKGHTRVRNDPERLDAHTSYSVKRPSESGEDLRVTQEEMLATVEEAVVDALREVMKAVDRDFALANGAQQ